MPLDQDQKDFITKRVNELGSLSKVKEVYKLDDNVSKFANSLAKRLFKPKKHRLKAKGE